MTEQMVETDPGRQLETWLKMESVDYLVVVMRL